MKIRASVEDEDLIECTENVPNRFLGSVIECILTLSSEGDVVEIYCTAITQEIKKNSVFFKENDDSI